MRVAALGSARGAARVLREVRPDVVALVGAPASLRWRSRCAALARRSGLVYVGGGRSAGSALLLAHLRVAVTDVQEVRTPGGGYALAAVRLAGREHTVGAFRGEAAAPPQDALLAGVGNVAGLREVAVFGRVRVYGPPGLEVVSAEALRVADGGVLSAVYS